MNLEIQFLSGDTETRPLDNDRPLSIGRAPSCDIVVDEADVGQMHCRVSWNGSAYEANAANLDGIEINGTIVRKALLKIGDILRIGSIDIRVIDDGAEVAGEAAVEAAPEEAPEEAAGDLPAGGGETGFIPLAESDDNIGLKPLDAGEPEAGFVGMVEDEEEEEAEEIRLPAEYRDESPPATSGPKKATASSGGKSGSRESGGRRRRRKKPPAEPEHPINQIFEDDDIPGEDPIDDLEMVADDLDEEPVVALHGQEILSRSRSSEEEEIEAEAAPPEPRPADGPGLAERLRPTARRPGDQETLKSPVVILLGGGALVLLLASATFYFMWGQNTIQEAFQAPEAAVAEGNYKPAIALLKEFKKVYTNNEEYKRKAEFLLRRAEIESPIAGTSPDWNEGLEAVERYRKATQDFVADQGLEGYDADKKGYLFDTVVRIAIGTATAAGKSLGDTAAGDDLLTLSKAAAAKLNLYKTDEEKFAGEKTRIEAAQKVADAKLLKQKVFDNGLGTILALLKKKLPMEVLKERRNLLIRYSEFGNSKVLEGELQKALAIEQAAISRDETVPETSTEENQAQRPPGLTLTLNTRARTDEKSEGRSMFVIGRDCFYGTDTVTGHPVWRRVIGLDLPFHPVAVPSAEPGLLLVDANFGELVLINRKDGKLQWRMPLEKDEQVVGPPLVTGGQVYLVSRTGNTGHLARVSLDTGRRTVRLSFSQPLEAPPVLLASGEQIVLAGEREVLYTLSLNPFQCQAVSYLGHPPTSIDAPMLAMGGLVLMPQNPVEGNAAGGEGVVVAQNDRIDSCLLRVVKLTAGGKQLETVTEVRLDGRVKYAPVLRGRDLFVPFSGERIVAFTVSDDPNNKTLTRVATHQVKTSHPGPVHLAVGPAGHLWMASTQLYRFQLTTDSLKLNPNRIASGISSQPLQSIGNQLFLGRKLPFSDSVVFTRVERDAEPQMTSHWRTIVGAGLLECQPLSNGRLLCVTETGGLFHVRESDLQAGGFKHEIDGELRLPEGLAGPLAARRLGDGRVVVWCGAPSPRMWVLNTVGTIEQEIDLQKEPLEAAPVLTAGGIVAPLPGRLKLVARSSGAGPAKEFPAPVHEGKKRRWARTVSIDRNHLLVVDSANDLIRLQYRTAPTPHLFPVNTLSLASPLDLDPLVHQEKIIVTTADGKLQVLGGGDLQVVAETQLPAAATAGPWGFGNRLLVESGRKTLLCLDLADNLKTLWSLDLDGQSVAGSPLDVGGTLVVAGHRGDVFAVTLADGTEANRLQLGQPVSIGPRKFGTMVLVTSIDGTIYRVESLLGGN